MIRPIKNFLFQTISLSNYLKILHIGFNIVFRLGLLKSDYIYKYHYFVQNLIKKGDVVIDIGANLGYYSAIFKTCVGKEGKVISIEPVKPFYEVLQWRFKNSTNIELYNFALGDEEKPIEILLPKDKKKFNSGLPSITNHKDSSTSNYIFKVNMVKASKLLSKYSKIDLIKCDIEGYESIVIPEMIDIIKKHLPILLIETTGNNKTIISSLLIDIGYEEYTLYHNKFQKGAIAEEFGDSLYIHSSKISPILDTLKKKGY